MRRHFLVFCLLLSLGFSVSGKGYKITVHLAAAKERQVFLTHYYGASVFIDDTVMTDISGTGIFQRDTLLPPGLYKIYLDQHNHFDFLLGKTRPWSFQIPLSTWITLQYRELRKVRSFWLICSGSDSGRVSWPCWIRP